MGPRISLPFAGYELQARPLGRATAPFRWSEGIFCVALPQIMLLVLLVRPFFTATFQCFPLVQH